MSKRTKDDIKRALAHVEHAWNKYPDLRLCQLITCATGKDDSFYVEDEDLLTALHGLIRELEEPK